MKRLTAILLVLLLLFGGAKPVSANSAQTYWEGVDRAGAIITDGDSPIVVEHELLTFDLQEFPQSHYNSEEAFLAYPGKVTARYTFHNPSDMTVTAKLLFPFGTVSWYGADAGTDIGKYDILIDGQPIEKTVRHTLSDNGQFFLSQDLALLSDDLAEDDFYSPDMTVTAYKFSVSGVDTSTYKSAAVAFDVPAGLGNRRFYLSDCRGSQRQDDGDMRVAIYIEESFYIYVIGQPLATMPEFKFYQNGAVRDSERISGTASYVESYTMTFQEFITEDWSEETGVSETDWYNAKLADLKNGHRSEEYPVVFRNHYGDFSQNLMRWYEYEITLEPGQRIVNTVTAPIYPSIDLAYNPDVYGYSYLLSPATTWQSFGELEIVINTPFYITHSTLSGFEKTETGYKADFDGLPNGELYFELSTAENPEPERGFNWGWLILLIYPFVLIAEAFEAIGEFFTNLFQGLF